MMSSLNDCVRHLLILLVSIILCSATIQSVTTRFTEKKKVATSHTTLQNFSKIKCVERCNKENRNGRCTLAGYNKATKTCFLSVDDPQDALDATDEMSGVFFYEPESSLTCATEDSLLDGNIPVPDSYFTASSKWDASYAAPRARLDGGGGFWSPNGTEMTANPLTCFLQVQFHTLSTVVRVATAGGAGWVSQYRLAYSEDCVNFNNLLDSAGNNVTFPGNTNYYSVVENQLPTPIPALCLRLHPLSANFFIDLQMEVYGCPSM